MLYHFTFFRADSMARTNAARETRGEASIGTNAYSDVAKNQQTQSGENLSRSKAARCGSSIGRCFRSSANRRISPYSITRMIMMMPDRVTGTCIRPVEELMTVKRNSAQMSMADVHSLAPLKNGTAPMASTASPDTVPRDIVRESFENHAMAMLVRHNMPVMMNAVL